MSEHLLGRIEHVLTGVREYAEGYPVELRRNPQTGRLMVSAWNEGHNNLTQVDLLDLLDWLDNHGVDTKYVEGKVK